MKQLYINCELSELILQGDQLGKYSGENEMPLWLRDYLLSQGQYSDDGTYLGARLPVAAIC